MNLSLMRSSDKFRASNAARAHRPLQAAFFEQSFALRFLRSDGAYKEACNSLQTLNS